MIHDSDPLYAPATNPFKAKVEKVRDGEFVITEPEGMRVFISLATGMSRLGRWVMVDLIERAPV